MTDSTRDLLRRRNLKITATDSFCCLVFIIFLFRLTGDSMQEYKTVEFASDDFFIEKKSKFIGYVKPVKTQEEATAFINEIKSKHWDATHNVYAYVLRDNNIQRYSDDGEPSGTAGVPVLDVIIKEGVVDVCVVATRYFGGTLLGAGGLVRAYSHTSKIALEAGHIITMAECSVLECEVEYSFYDRLNTLLDEFGANVINTDFSDNVKITLSVKADKECLLSAKLTDISAGKYNLKKTGTKFDKV